MIVCIRFGRAAKPTATLSRFGVHIDRLAGEPGTEEKENTMKRTVLGIVLLGLMSAGSLMAEDHDGRRDRDLRHDYADRRADYRDINRDRAAIDHDKWELRRDYREGNYAAAQRERAEMNNRYRDLNRDERDVRRDNRDIRGDRYWDWR